MYSKLLEEIDDFEKRYGHHIWTILVSILNNLITSH
jgi:hypothetical protein